MKVKVALGLSGGVDSAVCAYLLKKQGFDVSCIYLNCFDSTPAGGSGCRGDNDRKDALAVAMHLGLPFQVLDFRKEYQAAVIDYFKKEYLLGRTPNPDVVCNRDIKFGLFLDWVIKEGFDYVATGHYAKMATMAKNSYNHSNHSNLSNHFDHFLFRPTDLHKDQTYFLWAVPKEKFKRVLFPLGNLLKTEIRKIALKIGLPVAQKKDSTGICFVGEVRVEDFLKQLGVKEKKGEVVIRRKMIKMARDGKDGNHPDNPNHPNPSNHYSYYVIGSHRGVWFYTIGQRHGFSTDLRSSKNREEGRKKKEEGLILSDFSPLYVIEKDIKKNRLVVGFGAETYRDQFTVSRVNWLTSNFKFKISNLPHVYVRIRHGGELIPCSINALTHQRINISLSEAQRGIAVGQSAVFYNQEGIVLGGGVIQ